jgi:predicted RNA-binding protein with PIN domain
MHYLIDGHNLIGRMPDISLDDPQDEIELVLRLRSWSARSRKRRVTVVFDRGLPGGRDRGLSTIKVEVVFASAGRSADSILIARVKRVKNPREYTLVTSDNRIINEAGAKRMPVLRSEEFAPKLVPEIKKDTDQGSETGDSPDGTDPEVSNAEVEMWLNLFNSRQE